MVLVSNSISSDHGDAKLWPLIRHKGQDDDTKNGENDSQTQQTATCDAPDVLRTPKLLEDNDYLENNAPHLHTIQQAVILAKCLLLEKSSRLDEMQSNTPRMSWILLHGSLFFFSKQLSTILAIGIHSSLF